MMGKGILRGGAVLAFSSVAAGAYGSHLLHAHFQQDLQLDEMDVQRWKTVWDTAHKMHMFGAACTLAIAAGAGEAGSGVKSRLIRTPTLAALLLGGGTVIFSGSCYMAAYMADRNVGFAAPIGGTCMMLGSLALLL